MPTWGKSFSLALASLSWTEIGLAAGVGAHQLVAVVHVVDAVPLDGGGGGDADLGEVVLVGVGQLVVDRYRPCRRCRRTPARRGCPRSRRGPPRRWGWRRCRPGGSRSRWRWPACRGPRSALPPVSAHTSSSRLST